MSLIKYNTRILISKFTKQDFKDIGGLLPHKSLVMEPDFVKHCLSLCYLCIP